MMILVSILVLGILVFVHELGHFFFAKMFGVAIIEFAVGFGKKIVRKRVGETIYSIGLIPLGGYVRMAGDEPWEVERQANTAPGEQPPAPLTAEEQEEAVLKRLLLSDPSRWFVNKSLFAKALIVIAGPLFNVLFAWILAVTVIWAYGRGQLVETPVIGTIVPELPAQKAGFRAKDIVLNIDGKPIAVWRDLSDIVLASGGKPMKFHIERFENGVRVEKDIEVTATSDTDEIAVLTGAPADKAYRIGVGQDSVRIEATLLEAIDTGSRNIVRLSQVVIRGLVGMVSGVISTKNIAGPIYIFREAAHSAERGREDLLQFMTFLSLCLAIMNLLPIPVLDGGHLLFFLLEALKGGPLSPRIQEVATQLGMLLLLALMGFAVVNDIVRLRDVGLG